MRRKAVSVSLVMLIAVVLFTGDVLAYSNLVCDQNGCRTGYAEFCGTATTVFDESITDAKITGPISGNKLGPHSHSGGDITSGTINAARLPVGTSPDTVAAGSHNHDGIYLKKYAKVAVVARSGGDFTDPVAAMSNLAAWCRDPQDLATPCLVKIMPGIYDIVGNTLQMRPYVDIEGSGEGTTIVTGNRVSPTCPPAGVVSGANAAEIRLLTVRNTGIGPCTAAIVNNHASPRLTHVTATAVASYLPDLLTSATGVYNSFSTAVMTYVTAEASSQSMTLTGCSGIRNDTSSPTMTNVTATATGCGGTYGIGNSNSSPIMTNVTVRATGAGTNYGIDNNYSSPVMTNVTAEASSEQPNYTMYAITNANSSPTMTNVTATASGGYQNYGVYNFASSGTVKINHSVITGATNTIYNGSGVVTFVGNTQLDGGPVTGPGVACAGVYNEDYAFYANTCP